MGSSVAGSVEHTITLSQPLPAQLAEELRRRIFFLDERIVGFDLVEAEATVRELRVRTDAPVRTAELARKVNQTIAMELRPLPPADVRWRSARRDTVEPVFDELLARGLVETVLIGSRQAAAEFREGFLRRATALLDELGLIGDCAPAHDAFFGTDVAAESISVQRNLALKHEIRLAVAPDRTIAVGSVNAHDRRFGTAFDIRLPDGRRAHSACVGFGLERLTYAVLCQHGIDERYWPQPLRRAR